MHANKIVDPVQQKHLFIAIIGAKAFNLLEKPGEFMKDWRIRLTILRYLLRGRKRNAPLRHGG